MNSIIYKESKSNSKLNNHNIDIIKEQGDNALNDNLQIIMGLITIYINVYMNVTFII